MYTLDELIAESEKAKELYQILEKVYYDDLERGDKHKQLAFIIILARCETDEKRQKMIDVLKKWKLRPDDMTEVAWQIHDGIEPEIKDE